MTRKQTCQQIENVGLVPVVRTRSKELAMRAVDAILAGGISVFEITLTVPGAPQLIAALVERFDGRVLIGAGTVLTRAEAERCLNAGAQFVVSPGLNPQVVDYVQSRDVLMMPGALTPTEVMAAIAMQVDMIKVFPCSALGGAKYLRALRGPFPDVKLLPTGGVSLSTAADYVRAGATALGVGSELVNLRALDGGNDQALTEYARSLMQVVHEARGLEKTG